ncbi:hypothetical protein ACSZNO_21545 [Aeromonas veronii]
MSIETASVLAAVRAMAEQARKKIKGGFASLNDRRELVAELGRGYAELVILFKAAGLEPPRCLHNWREATYREMRRKNPDAEPLLKEVSILDDLRRQARDLSVTPATSRGAPLNERDREGMYWSAEMRSLMRPPSRLVQSSN